MDKVDVEFIIEGKNNRPIVYLYKRNDYIDSILRRYANEIKFNIKELSFEHNGSLIPLDSELTLGQINSEEFIKQRVILLYSIFLYNLKLAKDMEYICGIYR